MRQQFVECNSKEEAFELCPWAGWALECVGGFWMYESENDYNTAINQQ